ncbi:MAG: hypothetical protein IKW83_02565 [Muribaculaceae bacterium]|nr:hypothetical protein [Muribaculaceae bacterium]
MKRFCFSLMMIGCFAVCFFLTSCGDDEPVTKDFDKSELTNPMFLVKLNDFTAVEQTKNEFWFFSFNSTKIAYAKFSYKGARATVYCNYIYDWTMENGVLKYSNKSLDISKLSLLGIKAFSIANETYFPSSSVYGVNFEEILTKLGYDKARLWKALELSKTKGEAVYLDEVPKN